MNKFLTTIAVVLSISIFSCTMNNKTIPENAAIIKADESIKNEILVADTSTPLSIVADNKNVPFNVDSCQQKLVDILFSSDTFMIMTEGLSERVKQNGGTGFGVRIDNISLKNETNISYTMYENYPDRLHTIHNFKLDLNKKELYLDDNPDEGLINLKFDKSLIDNLSYCK